MKIVQSRTILAAMTVILLASTAMSAPTKKDYSPKLSDYIGGRSISSIGLLDPSRMTVNHSVQMGYSSFGGGSLMQSLYATSIGYRISDPLKMTVTLGLSGNRLNIGGTPTTFNSLIGGARLDYRPTKDFHLMLEFSRTPGLYQSNWRNDPYGFSTGFITGSGESGYAR